MTASRSFIPAEAPEYHRNLVQIFLERAARYKTRRALLFKRPPAPGFQSINWTDWQEAVRHTALGLYAFGVRKGDRVGILSENRPEWTMADLGILSLGAADVPIYPTSSAAEIAYILDNAGIEILFVSTAAQWEKIRTAATGAGSKIKKAILFDEVPEIHSHAETFSSVLEKGRLEHLNNGTLYGRLVADVLPEDVATIIYTSGTTGPPKGVMLTHRNFVVNYLAASLLISLDDRDVALSFLPLSHVFERLAGYYFMLFRGAAIAYAENMNTVPEDILTIRPTVCAAVPRFYEKIYARLLEKAEAAPPLNRRLFYWAKGIGEEAARKAAQGGPLPAGLRLKTAAARIFVLNILKKRLGGRIRFFISGGAPLAQELAEFFYAAGVLILEGYGLTETSPVMTVNSPEDFKFGTVGRVLPGIEVKIAHDGEILTRSECVMKGYYRNEEATREAMEGGWFHTGDIGGIDAEGFLKITDRKKDIIVTSGGKNVSPQNIENFLLGDKLFSQVVVLGDRKNYLVALIYPNKQEVLHYAAENGLSGLAWPDLLKHPKVEAWVTERLHRKTGELASYEQIKYFALLEQELSLESGELTPTLKTKRKVVMGKYAALIEELYRRGNEKRASLST